MSDEPTDLVLELLRAIRSDVTDLKAGQRELKQELISIRKQVHGLAGDGLRRETNIAAMQVDLDRIKARLDLSDA
ncbi:MAG: hypothetical protein AAFR76_03685 [Planctomycetota bacterium]